MQFSTAQTKNNSTVDPLKAILAEEKARRPALEEQCREYKGLYEKRGTETYKNALRMAEQDYFSYNDKISETKSKIASAKTELDNSTAEINGKISALQNELESLR